MSEDKGWWRPKFEMLSGARAKCIECGHELDIRGGRPQKHLASHGNVPRETSPEEPDDAVAEVEEGLAGLTRDERLRNLLFLANDAKAAQRDRVAAETLIAKYQGWLDAPPEEDEDESREKVVERARRAVERKDGLVTEFRKWTRDRETKAWVLRNLVATEDDREWAQKVLADLTGLSR